MSRTIHRWEAALLASALALAALAPGCQVEFHDGQFTCSTSAECPPGFGACVAGHCTIPDAWVAAPDAYRDDAWSADVGSDAQADADLDAQVDADLDAQVDADLDAASDVDAGAVDGAAELDASAPDAAP
jgi:hypothetical protein